MRLTTDDDTRPCEQCDKLRFPFHALKIISAIHPQETFFCKVNSPLNRKFVPKFITATSNSRWPHITHCLTPNTELDNLHNSLPQKLQLECVDKFFQFCCELFGVFWGSFRGVDRTSRFFQETPTQDDKIACHWHH